MPQASVDDRDLMVEGGAKGIVQHDNYFHLVEQVGKTEVEVTVKRWRAADSDARILKVQRDAAGNRNRPLADLVPLYT